MQLIALQLLDRCPDALLDAQQRLHTTQRYFFAIAQDGNGALHPYYVRSCTRGAMHGADVYPIVEHDGTMRTLQYACINLDLIGSIIPACARYDRTIASS